MSVLEIKSLYVSIEKKEIPKSVNLTMETREIHATMGPNGTGKSTLSAAIMGSPNYEVTEGKILFDEKDVLDLEVDERMQLGLLLATQYPNEIPGIANTEFMRAAINAEHDENDEISVMTFLKKLDEKTALLNMPEKVTERYLNESFSGGGKKRDEILQLLMLEPAFAVLDEIDSGLGIDALKVVAKGINEVRGDSFGALVITYYQRLSNYITPDVAHIMTEGRVVMTGNADLTKRPEAKGYASVSKELGIDYKEEET